MDFSLTEEQELLQDTVRGFVAKECPPQTVRAIFDGERSLASGLWKGITELGVAGLVVPESHGGAGLELLELALVAEELGRGAVPVPFLGHALATLALARAGSAALQKEWLPRLASGEARATAALAENGHWLPAQWGVELENGHARGRKHLVPEAEGADLFLVGCRGGALAFVEAGTGVRITAEPTLDRGRPLATLDLAGAPATPLASDFAPQLVDAGCVLLAADAFGATHQIVRATAGYVQTRRQFGQAIAQFQAVKHQLANMAIDIDPARGLWWYAAHAFDHAPSEAPRAAALAKSHITDRGQQVARDAVEAHGGIGFTWESDVHIWFKRILFDRLWLGAPELHRERFAALEGW